MNVRELLIKTVLDTDVSEDRIRQSLRILQERDMRIEKISGYLSIKDTMQYLGGISRVHLWKLRKKGLPSYQIGAKILFKIQEVDVWMDENCKVAEKKTAESPTQKRVTASSKNQ